MMPWTWLLLLGLGSPPPQGPVSNMPTVGECDRWQPAWIWCDDFEIDRLGAYFEYQSADGAFGREEGRGLDGSTGLTVRFKKGQVSAGAIHLAFGKVPQEYFRPVDDGATAYRELWWRVWVHYDPVWVGGGGVKIGRLFSFASPATWGQAMIAHLWSGGPGNQHLVLDPASGVDRAGRLVTDRYNDFDHLRWLGSVRTSPIFGSQVAGRWLCLESHIRLNDLGHANGVYEVTVDGRERVGRRDLDWVGSFRGYGLNALYLENYWNGGSPADQERTFDNLVVSRVPIGCGVGG